MSYIRQGDIMIHSVDLGQLASDSRLGSNLNHYDSMASAVTDSAEHYETLERLRNITGCFSGQQSQGSETNTSQKTYTRYIRPCPNLNGNNNSVAKPTNERIPVQLRTLKKRRSGRSSCRTRNVIFSFAGGIVIGFILTSVCWLTLDRLKESKIVCEFSEKTKDGREEDKDNGTKTSISVQSTVAPTQSHVTSDGRGTSKTSSLSSVTSKQNETSSSTLGSTTTPKLTSFSVSSTEMSTASRTSTNLTFPTESIAVTNVTVKTPTLSTDRIETTHPNTSQALINPETKVTDQTTTLSDKTTKTTDSARNTSVSSTFPTISNVITTEKDQNTTASAETKVFDFSKNTETSTHRPTSTIVANTTLSQSENPFKGQSMMTSTVLDSQSSQQSTVHPNEYNSSYEKGVSNSNISTSAFSTILSSAVHSSTLKSSDGSSSTLASLLKTTTIPTAASRTTTNSPSTVQSSTTEHPVIIGRRSVQGGHVYVRWGSLSCPDHADFMYKGYTAGGHWQHQGGATNTICLPEVPTWGNYSDNMDADRNLVYGTEYGSTDASFFATTGKKLRYKDVPCSVCLATGRLSHVMLPGKTGCFPGWTEEYKGYLMGSGYIQNHASELICVDSSPDHVTGSDAAKGGNYLYFAEVRTGSLPSSTYVNGRELACVVCTL